MKTYFSDCVNTHVLEVETHNQRAGSCHCWEKLTPPFSINTDLSLSIPLAEIIIIEVFIQIIQRTDLSISVGLAGTPSKHPYRANYFARKGNNTFPEACVTKPKIVLTYCVLQFSPTSH
jgi:hypothetical protein